MKTLIQIYEQVAQQISSIELFKKYWHIIKGMLYIYYFQTSDEKERETTAYKNFEGFQGPDATVLSPLCKQLINTGWLSPEQIEVIPKRMEKYQKQLDKIERMGLIDNDSEFKELVKNVIDKWKKAAKHNFNKWFGIIWYVAQQDFRPEMVETIKEKAREYGLYIFKISKFYAIFMANDYHSLIKFINDEALKSYRMSIHPSTDYPEFIGINTKGKLHDKFAFHTYNKNYIIKQIHKPSNLLEMKLSLLKEWGEASEKQLKYLSFLTKHDWTKMYVPFRLATKLITLAKDEHKTYEELKRIYDEDDDIKQRFMDEKRKREAEELKKKFEITMKEAKRHLMNNENKLVSFMNDILKKSINSKTQPYSLHSELEAKILDKEDDDIANLNKYIDVEKLAEYIKNKYFNNRIGKYFDAIGWPIELMITHNKKVFGFVVKILEDYLKQKLGPDSFKIEIEG